jgi:glutathione peroxidase
MDTDRTILQNVCTAVAGAVLCWAATVPAQAAAGDAPPRACTPLLQREVPRLQDEKPQDLCQYSGRVVVVVNTASFCGYTPQYKSLEALYAKYRERGLVVLGFPSNDFGQESGGNTQIAEFCEGTFGVKFPMFTKTHVAARGSAPIDPLFVALSQRTGQAPRWNFHKYVISRDGKGVKSFDSEVDPLSAGFVREVEALLDAK